MPIIYLGSQTRSVYPHCVVFDFPLTCTQRDENFIIIKRWIPKELQEELFEHTRRIKERNLRAFDGDVKQDDKLYIIRKKSPEVSRRSWMFS